MRLLSSTLVAARIGLAVFASGTATVAIAETVPRYLLEAWPKTDFQKRSISLQEIKSGGPGKDGIPAIDQPKFESVATDRASGWIKSLSDNEPVITVVVNGDARAYPIRILIWHEIVNDTVGGIPLSVTYCPLCNSSLVFDRRIGSQVLDFGTTGLLRKSDLVMYDRQTESWWQQFTGEAILGQYNGAKLKFLPSRIESVAHFFERYPAGRVLVPEDPQFRNYGMNPYLKYDEAGTWPFLFDGDPPPGVDAMERVIAVEIEDGKDAAWTLTALRDTGEIRAGDLVLRWTPGMRSPLDTREIASGRDVGNVTVQRTTKDGMIDVAFDLPFAFAFHAFRPGSPIHSSP